MVLRIELLLSKEPIVAGTTSVSDDEVAAGNGDAFEGVDIVFHTATADPDINNFQLHYKVNVEGTKNVIDACVTCKVKRLIYTSSSSVVFDGVHDLFDADESMPHPDKVVSALCD
ncbi:hypothetical protein ABZP36_019108 [Zizania latifolia]